jgi:hypothetical protein
VAQEKQNTPRWWCEQSPRARAVKERFMRTLTPPLPRGPLRVARNWSVIVRLIQNGMFCGGHTTHTEPVETLPGHDSNSADVLTCQRT